MNFLQGSNINLLQDFLKTILDQIIKILKTDEVYVIQYCIPCLGTLALVSFTQFYSISNRFLDKKFDKKLGDKIQYFSILQWHPWCTDTSILETLQSKWKYRI